MSKEFNNYKFAATGFSRPTVDLQTEWQSLYDWYTGKGRRQFMDAFARETGLRFGQTVAPDDLVGAAIPKTYGDLESKAQDDAFYRAHAAWFLEEMDHIVASVPRDANSPIEAQGLRDILEFTRAVLMDSVLLFEDWGANRAGYRVSTASERIRPNT